VAAEREEIVVDADLRHGKDLAPDVGYGTLDSGARRCAVAI